MLRLHDGQSGRILLGGVDLRDLPQSDLRERIGCVPQKAFLFGGTIAENLRMGRASASDELLWEALRIAQAEAFVKQLPLRLEAPVAQGGTNFSGGQRQRLAIARALVKRADILLFDDSFSALDGRTDAALRRALRQSVTAPAKLIIAQRVSTVLDADQILVLDQGLSLIHILAGGIETGASPAPQGESVIPRAGRWSKIPMSPPTPASGQTPHSARVQGVKLERAERRESRCPAVLRAGTQIEICGRGHDVGRRRRTARRWGNERVCAFSAAPHCGAVPRAGGASENGARLEMLRREGR